MFNYFRRNTVTVDSIVSGLSSLADKLEALRAERLEASDAKWAKIAVLEDQASEDALEAARASSVAEKIRDLVSV
jgi:hypothetical protein